MCIIKEECFFFLRGRTNRFFSTLKEQNVAENLIDTSSDNMHILLFIDFNIKKYTTTIDLFKIQIQIY